MPRVWGQNYRRKDYNSGRAFTHFSGDAESTKRQVLNQIVEIGLNPNHNCPPGLLVCGYLANPNPSDFKRIPTSFAGRFHIWMQLRKILGKEFLVKKCSKLSRYANRWLQVQDAPGPSGGGVQIQLAASTVAKSPRPATSGNF